MQRRTKPPLAIEEYEAGDIKIYPNPTYDEITLKINDYQGPIKVQIHDLNGKLVKEFNERNIDLTSLESGVYSLLVNYGDKDEFKGGEEIIRLFMNKFFSHFNSIFTVNIM